MANVSKVKLPNNISYNITDANALHSSDKGSANGVAPLNASGLIESAYLPSYVDDVIEGYYYNDKFWKESTHITEITGEAGKIYVDLAASPANTYRYTGSAFVSIGTGGGPIVTVTRDLTSGTKSATISINGTGYDLYSTNDTTYGAGTGISLDSNNLFSVKLGYTTSGDNRAVQADSSGNLYVVQTDTTYSRETPASGGTTLSLVNTGDMYTWNNKASVVIQSTAPTGDTNVLWVDTSNYNILKFYDGTNWTPIGSAWD